MTMKSNKFKSIELSDKDLDTPLRTIMNFIESESGATGNASPLLSRPHLMTKDSHNSLSQLANKLMNPNVVIVPGRQALGRDIEKGEGVIT